MISAIKILNSIEIIEYLTIKKHILIIFARDKLIKYDRWTEDEKEIKEALNRFSIKYSENNHFQKYCRIF